MVICLERGADLHTAQLMPLALTVSCFSKIQIGFTFLVPAHLGSPGKTAVKQVRVCVFLGETGLGRCPLISFSTCTTRELLWMFLWHMISGICNVITFNLWHILSLELETHF